MITLAPVTLEGHGVRLEPLTLAHEAGIGVAASDGNLHELWWTSVPAADQVAQYISQLTEADTVKPTETIQPGHAGDRVFEAAFPTTLMPHLPCLQGDSPG